MVALAIFIAVPGYEIGYVEFHGIDLHKMAGEESCKPERRTCLPNWPLCFSEPRSFQSSPAKRHQRPVRKKWINGIPGTERQRSLQLFQSSACVPPKCSGMRGKYAGKGLLGSANRHNATIEILATVLSAKGQDKLGCSPRIRSCWTGRLALPMVVVNRQS